MSETTEPRRRPGRPRGTTRGGPTTKRNIRVGQVWDRLEAHYKAEGVNMSDLVKRLLEAEAARLNL